MQGALLTVYTAGVLVVTLLVQGGRPGRTNLAPFEDVRRLVDQVRRGELLSSRVLYAALGIAGNVALFAGWAFLVWKFLDAPARKSWKAYLEVAFLGLLFSAAIEFVQFFLPTRAADVNDVVWNGAGALLGALLAHGQRDLRVVWE